MAYKGFVGSGTVGHFATTTVLELQFPAQLHAGRMATVEAVVGTATHYFSDGASWKPQALLATDPLTGKVAGLIDPKDGSTIALGGNALQTLLTSPVLKATWLGNSIIANAGRMLDRLTVLSSGRLVTVNNAGHSGYALAGIIAEMAVDISPLADIVFVSEGSNGATTGTGTSLEYSQMCTVSNYIKSLGKIAVICASPPRSSTAQALKYTNRYPFAERLAAIDTGALFVDPWYDWRGPDGAYAPGYSDDATHPATTQYWLYERAAKRIWEQLNPFFDGGKRAPYMEVTADMDNAGYSGLDQSANFLQYGNAMFLNGTAGWDNSDATKVTLSTSSATPFRGNKMVMTSAGVSSTPVLISRNFLNTTPPSIKPVTGDVLEARAVVECVNLINAVVNVTLKSPSNFSEQTLVSSSASFAAEMFSATAAWGAGPNAPTQIVVSIAKSRNMLLTATGSGTNLTVSAVNTGAIPLGCTIAGSGVTAGTKIVSQTSGTPGGAGVYVTDQSSTASGSIEVLATGVVSISNADLYNLTKLRTGGGY